MRKGLCLALAASCAIVACTAYDRPDDMAYLPYEPQPYPDGGAYGGEGYPGPEDRYLPPRPGKPDRMDRGRMGKGDRHPPHAPMYRDDDRRHGRHADADRKKPGHRKHGPIDAAPAKDGAWRVQLGAFSQASRATTLWTRLSAKVPGLSAHRRYLVKSGGLTRLQAGPLPNKAAADRLCAKVKATGNACITKRQ